MVNIKTSRAYKKNLKKLSKSGNFNKKLLIEIIQKILNGTELEEKRKDHQLNGTLAHLRECHIGNDLLLIYEFDKSSNILHLSNIGSHSDLFE